MKWNQPWPENEKEKILTFLIFSLSWPGRPQRNRNIKVLIRPGHTKEKMESELSATQVVFFFLLFMLWSTTQRKKRSKRNLLWTRASEKKRKRQSSTQAWAHNFCFPDQTVSSFISFSLWEVWSEETRNLMCSCTASQFFSFARQWMFKELIRAKKKNLWAVHCA